MTGRSHLEDFVAMTGASFDTRSSPHMVAGCGLVHLSSTRPCGDGVRWRVHYTRVVDDDEEMPAEDDRRNRGRGGFLR